MIFVTVGSNEPFDRLVHAVDRWAEASGRADVFAQVGATDAPPAFIEWARFLSPDAFALRMAEAELVVAHAGTGTIFGALEHGRPLLVLPRRAALGETRNEHQLATAERFGGLGYVEWAADEEELVQRLADLHTLQTRAPVLPPRSSGPLVDHIRSYLSEHLG